MPRLTLELLFSNGTYGDVLTRLLGVILVALGIYVLQTLRYKLEPLPH